jgi:hypothetical protein
MRRCYVTLLAGLLGVWMLPSEAHKPSDSYLIVTQRAGSAVLEGQWDIALRDLEHAIGLDLNGDGSITWGELKARRAAITGYALPRLHLEAIAHGEREACTSEFRELLFDVHVDGGYAVLRFGIRCPFAPAQLVVHYGLLFEVDPNHRGLLDVRTSGAGQAFVLAQNSPTATANLRSPARWDQFRAFIDEGIWHIWSGYDHILFLLTLLLPAVLIYSQGRWQPRPSLRDALVDVFKVVSAFTVAHSLTLCLAVNDLVRLPSRLVESGIALTVLLGALNTLFPLVRTRRWLVAFTFGLVHGLGFASVLSDLGLEGWNLTLALVGFNAGVEVGQLAIVLIFVPLAYALRGTPFYRRAFVPAGAAAIGCTAAYWLALRSTGAL